MKKSVLIPLGLGLGLAGMCVSLYIFTPKQKIDLVNKDGVFQWINRGNIESNEFFYELYNGEFKIISLKGDGYKLLEGDLIDIDGPSRVSDATIMYDRDYVYISWNEAEDISTKNIFQLFMVDENGKDKYISNKEVIEYSSGIDRYIIKNNGLSVDSVNNDLKINRASLVNGLNYITIVAQDKRGNLGKEAKIPIYNYPIVISSDGENIGYHIDDRSQTYNLIAYVNGEKIEIGNNIAKLNEYIKDINAPSKVDKINVSINDKSVRINWSASRDVVQKYTISLEGVGTNYKNIAYSDSIDIDTTSGLKGYYYSINDKKDYVVSNVDNFVDTVELSKSLEYGKYFIHIAAVDNKGNVGETKTYSFSVDEPIKIEEDTNDNNSEVIVTPPSNNDSSLNQGNNGGSSNDNNSSSSNYGIVYGRDSVSKSILNKAYSMINKIPSSIVSKLSNASLKVYITGSSAEKTYEELSGVSISGITGIFYPSSKGYFVIVEDAYVSTVLYHEVAHAIDNILGGSDYLSNSGLFNDIYLEEKESLFEGDSNISNIKEYFAESFNLYMIERDMLKLKAPKTMYYFDELLS